MIFGIGSLGDKLVSSREILNYMDSSRLVL